MYLACFAKHVVDVNNTIHEPLIGVADFSDSFDGGSVNVVLAG